MDAHHCSLCGKPGKPKLKLCGKCKVQRYCSAVCQQADWARHKPECKEREQQREAEEREARIQEALREAEVVERRERKKLIRAAVDRICKCCRRVEKEGEKFRLCARCRGEMYCGASCLATDWPRHQLECTPSDTRTLNETEQRLADIQTKREKLLQNEPRLSLTMRCELWWTYGDEAKIRAGRKETAVALELYERAEKALEALYIKEVGVMAFRLAYIYRNHFECLLRMGKMREARRVLKTLKSMRSDNLHCAQFIVMMVNQCEDRLADIPSAIVHQAVSDTRNGVKVGLIVRDLKRGIDRSAQEDVFMKRFLEGKVSLKEKVIPETMGAILVQVITRINELPDGIIKLLDITDQKWEQSVTDMLGIIDATVLSNDRTVEAAARRQYASLLRYMGSADEADLQRLMASNLDEAEEKQPEGQGEGGGKK